MMAVMFLSQGCDMVQKQVDHVNTTQQRDISDRFKEPKPSLPTAVQSAVEMSEKYAEAMEKNVELKEQIQQLTLDKTQLEDELKPCQEQLTQAKKEVKEANDFVVTMQIELNNWKADILGFREEMRNAEKVQIETLLKIMEVMGGEVTADKSPKTDTNSGTASSGNDGVSVK